MSSPQARFGTYTGNGTAKTVSLGFRPGKLEIFNETDGDSKAEFIDGLAAGKAYVNNATNQSLLAANGITLSADGFSVGSDASVNENLKVFRYHASRAR
jgi:hypothetical protein